jgi:hypothetical protein
MDRLPDVSNYQGIVDWAQVLASGRAGGICKATEGLTFIDGAFGRNWATLRALNARRGAYHFARPGAGTPEQQAARFLSVVAAAGRDPADLLILDLEVGDGNLDDFALRWLAFIERQTGTLPWFYSYGPFIRAHLSNPALARYPLWIAAYTSTPPPAPPPWSSWQLWQHTDKATIPGVRTPCDDSQGTLTAPHPSAAPVGAEPVHDFEENTVKQTMIHIGPLDSNGAGWADWQPGLGRDPNPVGLVLLGPSPPDDGYWPQQAKVLVAAQPRGGSLRVSVRNGTPGDTVTCFVTVT